MNSKFTFEEEQFTRIFPFYISIDKDLRVVSTGATMEKLNPGSKGNSFTDYFNVVRPHISEHTFKSLQALSDQLVIIECKNNQQTTLRGQIEWIEASESLIFIGSPWFESVEKVTENKLSINDFAYHDPMIDLLHLLKTQEITTDDLKHLLSTVNKQKNDLKNAAKEIEDIALFPTQNPDPLIRIDLDGNVLRQNPAADKLTHFEYNGKVYTAEEFWKYTSEKFSLQQDRIIIEAESANEIYSFVIKPLPESGYYNIYGRKATEQKRNEEQLEILSSIAAQNTHGVVIANKEGKVEWANSSFEKMTGYSLKEIVGKKPGHFLQGPDSDPETIAYLSYQIAKGEPFGCEILNYNKNKKPYWLRIQGQALFDKNGNIAKYFAIEEDITKEREDQEKLREFEKRFRMALEKIGDYVWEHNFETNLTTFSKKDNHFLGVNIDEINNLDETWLSNVIDQDRYLIQENYENYKTGKIDNHVLEYRVKHKDGSIKWVLDRGVIIEKDAFGKPVLSIGAHTDITKQKTLELELSATANRLSSLIQNLYSGVLLENEDRQIGLINQKFCDIFQIPVNPEHLVGADCSKAAEQSKHLFKEPEKFIERVTEILAEKSIVIKEHLEMADGKHLHRDYIPIWNRGKYTGHLWLYTDITDQINVDEKLKEQRTFYEQILNNTPADIAVFDNQHRYLFLNPQAIKNPELRSWMIWKKDEDYFDLKKLPGTLLKKRKQLFQNVIDSKKLHSFEEELKKPDGSSNYILRNFYPVLDEQGEVEMVVGYGVDITQVKEIQHKIEESEKRYRDVIENSLAIITTHDLDGKLLSVNPMVSKTYGYQEKEMIGHSIAEFMPDSDKKLFYNKYLEKIKSEKQDNGILRVRSKSGKILFTLYHNFLKEEPEKDPYVISFAVDITERINAERELRKAKRATEELAEAKQNFLANMSHEIRTPMNAIIGMSNQLRKTELTDQQTFYLNTIHTASENLLVIINDILDLSKIEAGKLGIEEIAFEPKKVIRNAMQVMMHKAEEKGIELTNSFYDNNLWDVLVGDPYRLNQVLLNLISNAIKFTDEGRVDITCKVLHNAEDSQSIKVSVLDTGIGMDNEFLQNPFSKFSQEDVSISRKFGGTGLGMTITQSLIKLMGGSIKVSSKKHEGTIISFELTLKKGNIKDVLSKDFSEVDTKQLVGRKILVVDDNEMNRLVASTILQNYNAEITEAQNGKHALELLDKLKPEVILMDLQMPVLNGFEATKEIRERGNNIPIIALTANAIKGEDEKCYSAGMNDYLAKPYKENELLNKLLNWLDKTATSVSADENKKLDSQTREEDTSPLYDLSGLEEISRGNNEFIIKMINLFCDQTPQMVTDMITAYQTGDYQRMGALAHKMKPSIDNLRINSIRQQIRTIEKAGKNDETDSSIEDILREVEATIQNVIQQMKRDFTASG